MEERQDEGQEYEDQGDERKDVGLLSLLLAVSGISLPLLSLWSASRPSHEEAASVGLKLETWPEKGGKDVIGVDISSIEALTGVSLGLTMDCVFGGSGRRHQSREC